MGLENLDRGGNLLADDQLKGQLLKSAVLNNLGRYSEGLKVAEWVLQESQRTGKKITMVDAVISYLEPSVHFELHEESLELIEKAETALTSLLNEKDPEIMQRKAALDVHKGRVYSSKGDYNQALEYLQQSLTLWKELNSKRDIAWVLHNLGYTYGAKGDQNWALNYLKQSLALREELDIKHEVANTLHVIGWIYWDNADWEQAMEYYERSLTLGEELESTHVLAHSFNAIAWIYRRRGDLDRALTNLEQSLALQEEFGSKQEIAHSLLNISHIYREKGDLNQALDYLQQSLKLFEEIGDEQGIYWYFTNISTIYRLRGDLDRALDYLQQNLTYFKEKNDKYGIAWCLVEIGNIYRLKGDLDQALEFLQQGLTFYEKLGYDFFIAGSLTHIGTIHRLKGNLDRALQYLEKSLIVYEEIGNSLYKSETLFFLISVAIDKNDLGRTWDYLQRLGQINEQEENRIISQRYRVAEALVLKISPRIKSRGKAQELLEQVTEEEIVDHELTVTALLSLCDLLLLELRMLGLSEVLDEVQMHVNRLLEIAEQQKSHWLLAETYLLRSKLALVELNLKEAQQFLDKAQKFAEEKQLRRLSMTISREKALFQDQIDKWQHLIERNAPMSERLELVQLESLVIQLARKRLMVTEEETLRYAQEAQRFVEEWEKMRSDQ